MLASLATSLLLIVAAFAPARAQELPASSLAVLRDGAWQTWWRSADAPRRWAAPVPAVAGAVEWRAVRPGLELAELDVAADGMAWRLRVVLVRLDAQAFRLALTKAVRDAGTRGAWVVESAPAEAALALNAGQFDGALPWGWVVRGGREVRLPGAGPLSMALVVDTAGRARLVTTDSIAGLRAGNTVAEAFQSYPLLLRDDGAVPDQLAGPGRGVDVAHRDARLAIGELRDGRILIALTRFNALGPSAGSLPFGPTTPEMAALMGALGCREAMLLDGGLSAQLVVRDHHGGARSWPGWRRVPLALLALPRVPAIHRAP